MKSIYELLKLMTFQVGYMQRKTASYFLLSWTIIGYESHMEQAKDCNYQDKIQQQRAEQTNDKNQLSKNIWKNCSNVDNHTLSASSFMKSHLALKYGRCVIMLV